MSDRSIPKLIKRIDNLFSSSERSQNEKVWQELSALLLPNQSGIFNRAQHASTAAGQKKTQEIFTSFPIDQAQKLTSALQGILTNQATPWSKYREARQKLNDDKEVNAWFAECDKVFHNKLNESNFYTESPKGYQQWVTLGNMALFHEEKEESENPNRFSGFKFTAIHLSQIAWAENKDGLVNTVAYKFELTAEQAMEKWGDYNSDVIKRAMEVDPDRQFQFVLWIAPRDKSKVNVNELGVASPKERPIESLYICMDSKEVIAESGYYEFPVYCPRWDMLPGERYGRGRGHLALPDIKSLNKLSKQYQKAIDKDIEPPILVNARDILGPLSRNPGAITVTKDINGYKEMISNARTDRTTELYREYKENIKSMFFIDQILLPPREDIGQMREAEVLHRIKQIHTVFGPIVPRMNAECLTPLVIRSFKMLLRAGEFPPLPQRLKDEGLDLEVVFMNELATAQKMAVVTNNQQFLQQVGIIGQFNPAALDMVNFDSILVEDGRAIGISETILQTEEVVKQVRESRAKQQAAQAALQAANLAADTQAKAKNSTTNPGGSNVPT